jgi:hypothetical protein
MTTTAGTVPEAVLQWNGGVVCRLAEAVAAGRLDLAPVLADALLDAGCEDDWLLRSLRLAGRGSQTRDLAMRVAAGGGADAVRRITAAIRRATARR